MVEHDIPFPTFLGAFYNMRYTLRKHSNGCQGGDGVESISGSPGFGQEK